MLTFTKSQEGHHLKGSSNQDEVRQRGCTTVTFDRIPASTQFLLQTHRPCQPVNMPCLWEIVKDAGQQLERGGAGVGTPWEQGFP